jgi:hypothetical protein
MLLQQPAEAQAEDAFPDESTVLKTTVVSLSGMRRSAAWYREIA